MRVIATAALAVAVALFANTSSATPITVDGTASLVDETDATIFEFSEADIVAAGLSSAVINAADTLVLAATFEVTGTLAPATATLGGVELSSALFVPATEANAVQLFYLDNPTAGDLVFDNTGTSTGAGIGLFALSNVAPGGPADTGGLTTATGSIELDTFDGGIAIGAINTNTLGGSHNIDNPPLDFLSGLQEVGFGGGSSLGSVFSGITATGQVDQSFAFSVTDNRPVTGLISFQAAIPEPNAVALSLLALSSLGAVGMRARLG